MKRFILYIVLFLFSFNLIFVFKVIDSINREYFHMVYNQPSINKLSKSFNNKLPSILDSTLFNKPFKKISANFEYPDLDNYYKNEITLTIWINCGQSVDDKKTQEIINSIFTLIKKDYTEKILYDFTFNEIIIYAFNISTTSKYRINWKKNSIILINESKY